MKYAIKLDNNNTLTFTEAGFLAYCKDVITGAVDLCQLQESVKKLRKDLEAL